MLLHLIHTTNFLTCSKSNAANSWVRHSLPQTSSAGPSTPVPLTLSHWSMQSLWKSCWQGMSRRQSPFSKSTRQIWHWLPGMPSPPAAPPSSPSLGLNFRVSSFSSCSSEMPRFCTSPRRSASSHSPCGGEQAGLNVYIKVYL